MYGFAGEVQSKFNPLHSTGSKKETMVRLAEHWDESLDAMRVARSVYFRTFNLPCGTLVVYYNEVVDWYIDAQGLPKELGERAAGRDRTSQYPIEQAVRLLPPVGSKNDRTAPSVLKPVHRNLG